jgi:hypothetical protein
MRHAATKRSETFLLFENFKPAERACRQFSQAPLHVGAEDAAGATAGGADLRQLGSRALSLRR